MTTFVKIKDGIVVQKQPYAEAGFIQAPDTVVCGMLFDGSGYSTPVVVAPTPSYRLYKSDFIRRMSASEATAFETAFADEEPYLRLLYNSVEYFVSNDALLAYLHMSLSAAFGEPRADALLAP